MSHGYNHFTMGFGGPVPYTPFFARKSEPEKQQQQKQPIQQEEEKEENALVQTFECVYLSGRERYQHFHWILYGLKLGDTALGSVAYSIKVLCVLVVILPLSPRFPSTPISATVMSHYKISACLKSQYLHNPATV